MRTTLHVVAVVAAALIAGAGGCGGEGVSREVGARCSSARDCADRCLGPSNDFPDGFCSLSCSDARDCPGDTDCIDKEGGVCLFYCVTSSDCDFLGPNWVCRDENLRSEPNRTVGVCLGN